MSAKQAKKKKKAIKTGKAKPVIRKKALKPKKKAVKPVKEALEGLPFDCLLCGKEFRVAKEQLVEGERVECPVCSTVFVLVKKNGAFVLTEEEKPIEAEIEYDYE